MVNFSPLCRQKPHSSVNNARNGHLILASESRSVASVFSPSRCLWTPPSGRAAAVSCAGRKSHAVVAPAPKLEPLRRKRNSAHTPQRGGERPPEPPQRPEPCGG